MPGAKCNAWDGLVHLMVEGLSDLAGVTLASPEQLLAMDESAVAASAGAAESFREGGNRQNRRSRCRWRCYRRDRRCCCCCNHPRGLEPNPNRSPSALRAARSTSSQWGTIADCAHAGASASLSPRRPSLLRAPRCRRNRQNISCRQHSRRNAFEGERLRPQVAPECGPPTASAVALPGRSFPACPRVAPDCGSPTPKAVALPGRPFPLCQRVASDCGLPTPRAVTLPGRPFPPCTPQSKSFSLPQVRTLSPCSGGLRSTHSATRAWPLTFLAAPSG
mmetsp:Transcript_90467/g.255371  ORF Transcript_90467/g.255371 Transcript_90467/m.255371 type:complete len:277 (-) Transcript_90467:1604-2434(-)